MELIRTPQVELANLIERTLKRNGFQVHRHEDEGQFVLSVPDAEQYPHARTLTAELIADLKRGQDRQAVEPLTGQPQPLLSGGWLASMGWVTKLGLGLCVAIFLTPYLMGDGVYLALLFPATMEGLTSQPWRLITPMLQIGRASCRERV